MLYCFDSIDGTYSSFTKLINIENLTALLMRVYRNKLVIKMDAQNNRQSLIEKEKIAEQLGVSINTLYAWIHQKRIPYVKIGRLVKFDQADIDAWITQRKVKVRNFD